MDDKKITKIFNTFSKENPNPKIELNYKNHFELLIAVLLSAQATDISVNKATKALFAKANNPEEVLKLGEENLKEHIKSIGLYNTKARNVIKLSKILEEEHNSKVPKTRKELEKLPGIGRKSANIILNLLFNKPTIAVDTHVFRVSNRIGLAKGKNPIEVEEQLNKNIPTKYLKKAHYWIVLHGRYVCTARKPKCPTCGIKNLCEFKNKTT